jgi:hypothetical protein
MYTYVCVCIYISNIIYIYTDAYDSKPTRARAHTQKERLSVTMKQSLPAGEGISNFDMTD